MPGLNINEIAEMNGVSLSTLYRVMRHAGKTEQPQHRKLRAMLMENGFMPPSDTHVGPLLMVTAVAPSWHSVNFYRAVMEYAEERNISLVTLPDNDLARGWKRERYAGILSLSDAPYLEKIPLPVVKINRLNLLKRDCSMVLRDSATANLNILRKLRAAGCAKVGFHLMFNRGFEHKLLHGLGEIPAMYEAAGLEYAPELLHCETATPKTHIECCRRSAEYFADMRVDAIMIDGDVCVGRIAERLTGLGVRIPQDIRLATRDDVTFWRDETLNIDEMYRLCDEDCMHVPGLIYPEMPLREMARTALDLLLAHVRNPELPCRRVFISSPIREIPS